eukprot:scaffold242484_cov33-Prasinocladus_malaysianus.AAC.1
MASFTATAASSTPSMARCARTASVRGSPVAAKPAAILRSRRPPPSAVAARAASSGIESIPGFGSGGLKGGLNIGKGSKFIKPEDVVLESD